MRVAAADIKFSLPSVHLQLTSNLSVAAADMKLSLHCADLQLTTDLRVADANMKLSLHCADLQLTSDLCWQLQTYKLPAVSLQKNKHTHTHTNKNGRSVQPIIQGSTVFDVMGRGIHKYAAAMKKSSTSNASGRFHNYNACNTCRAQKKRTTVLTLKKQTKKQQLFFAYANVYVRCRRKL